MQTHRDARVQSISGEGRGVETVVALEPINLRLQRPKLALHLEPRRYQLELLQRAIEQNVIICLGTGLGKTFIVVMLINCGQIDDLIRNNKKVIFLAPTQDLVKQQADYINKHITHRVKVYCGQTSRCGMHIDLWQRGSWDAELDEVDIMFMTPQIFLSAVNTGLLDWTRFASIVFDESHHACKSKKSNSSGSPYRQILLHYADYFRLRPDKRCFPRPRLVGLTASLINRMPKNRQDIVDQITDVEMLFHGICITDIDVTENKPQVILHSYLAGQVNPCTDVLAQILSNIATHLNFVLKLKELPEMSSKKSSQLSQAQKRTLSFINRLKRASMGFTIKPSSFPVVITGIVGIRVRCGSWITRVVCAKLVLALKRHTNHPGLMPELVTLYKKFSRLLEVIVEKLDQLIGDTWIDVKSCKSMDFKFVATKPMALLGLLKSEYDRLQECLESETERKASFSCIVFVQSRLEVVALNDWLQTVSQTVPEYNFIRSNYAIGIAATMSSVYACVTKRKPSQQSQMLGDFRQGLLNVILTTSVLEEGIDLPVCSTVIRYDKPKSFREYVQSRGRARQRVSTFLFICPMGDELAMEKDLSKYNDMEETLKQHLQKHKNVKTKQNDCPVLHSNSYVSSELRFLKETQDDEQDCFRARENSIRVDGSTARVLLYMYCHRLARNSPYSDTIHCDRDRLPNGKYQTTLYLPCMSSVTAPVVSAERDSTALADNSAIVGAIRALYEAGELNEHCVPARAADANVSQLLAKHKLKPNSEPLGKLAGESQEPPYDAKEPNKEAQFYFYKPLFVSRSNKYMSANFRTKTYKLYRLSFDEASPGDARPDVREYFQTKVYGLLVEADLLEDVLPASIVGHYGKFSAKYELISNSFKMQEHSSHNECVNFNHKLLTRCLSVGHLDLERLRTSSKCYVVILNKLDNDQSIDYDAMRAAFGGSMRTPIYPGTVVQFEGFYRKAFEQPYSKFIVLSHRVDLDANSTVPGMRYSMLEDCERRFGPGSVRHIKQPVYEVIRVAQQIGRGDKPGREQAKHRESNRAIYLGQFLTMFDRSPAAVMQAFNLAEIIYRVHLSHVADELHKDLSGHADLTAVKRHPDDIGPAVDIQGEEEDTHVDPTNKNNNSDDMAEDEFNSIGEYMDDEDDDPYDAYDENVEDEDIDELEAKLSDLDISGDSVDGDLHESRDASLIGIDYNRLINSTLNLKDNNEDRADNLKPWNLDNYKAEDLARMIIQRSASHHVESTPSGPVTESMSTELQQIGSELLQQIQHLEFKLTCNATLEYDELEFKKNNAIVAHVNPPIKLDLCCVAPLRGGSITRSLLEALTTRKAADLYNLEALENVGDSFLKYVVSVVLVQLIQSNEGFLTSARSMLTSNKNFTRLSRLNRLGEYAITFACDKDSLCEAMGGRVQSPLESRLRPKQLADLFESIVGAYLVSQGEFKAIQVINSLGLNIFDDKNLFSEFSPEQVIFSRGLSPTHGADTSSEDFQNQLKQNSSRLCFFEQTIGYKFKNLAYLLQAFTHSSSLCKCTRSYERLEFLGDAVLDYLTTMTLVSYDVWTPGKLTLSRSALVNNYAFARLAMKYKYDFFIQHFNIGLYDELVKIRLAREDDPEMNFIEMIDYDRIVKLLGDLFESVAGAIYLDSGCSLDAVWKVYYSMMKESIDKELVEPTMNPIMKLFEMFPGSNRVKFQASPVDSNNGSMIEVECTVVGFGKFTGQGFTNRQAKLRAVAEALKNPPSAEHQARLDRDFRNSNQVGRDKHPKNLAFRGGRGGASARGRGGRGGGRGAARGGGGDRHPNFEPLQRRLYGMTSSDGIRRGERASSQNWPSRD